MKHSTNCIPGNCAARSGETSRDILASKQDYSYIERCFRWAHEADPQALLFYNEAEAEVMNPKSDAIYAMVRDFRQRGVPIDGVGMQMHVANLHVDVRFHFGQYQAPH